ncbi:MAG: hypothetical protein ACFFED_08205 [Candidatus Thorarchaeota archaeon]
MTPLLKHRGESFVVIGTEDTHYDDEIVARVAEEGNCEVYAVQRGNHSLDIPTGLVESMRTLTDIMSEMRNFITK